MSAAVPANPRGHHCEEWQEGDGEYLAPELLQGAALHQQLTSSASAAPSSSA